VTLSAAALRVGDRHEEVVVDNLTRTQIVMYAGASGDFHPFHHDEVYARAMGQAGIFAHGMLTMALTGKMLTNFVGDGRLTHYSARFQGQVWPGDTLTASARVTALRQESGTPPQVDLLLSTVNQKGEEVLSGKASARIDA
jgi:acyl dehydratase